MWGIMVTLGRVVTTKEGESVGFNREGVGWRPWETVAAEIEIEAPPLDGIQSKYHR